MDELILDGDNTFKYMLLARLHSDLDYYLGNGNRSKRNLWSGNEEDHINDMKKLHNSFSDDEKPEWLTMADIEEYEKNVCTSSTSNVII